MKIVVLQPDYKTSTSAIKDLDFARDLSPWLPGHEVEHIFIEKASAARVISTLEADVFINLCDGAWDEDSAGIEVVLALETRRKAFTGASSAFYDPSKESMKLVCQYWGISTPKHVFAYDEEDIERACRDIPLPAFVKHFHGCNSIGITAESKVSSYDDLRKQARQMVSSFGGALIEEFIEGREFSVLVYSNPDNQRDPYVCKAVECVFEDGMNFKTFDYKWGGDAHNPWISVSDTELNQKLQEMTKTAFLALGGEGYARSDIRMDQTGNLYFLELNPNCSVFYPDDNGATADVILQLDSPSGKQTFASRIIDFAIQRSTKTQRKYVVRLSNSGNGIFASKDIAAGELIYKLEESPHVLVSREKVEQTWGPRDKQFFIDFCYPLTDDLFVMWDVNPDSWKPINHSCDPNSWVTGLDLYARRAISKGEEIRMDYATMYTYPLMEFQCSCGAAICRKTLKGGEFLEPWFRECYGPHVTDYVRQKQKLFDQYGIIDRTRLALNTGTGPSDGA